MRILFINNDGGGFADHIEVANGTTVQDLFDQQVRSGKSPNYHYSALFDLILGGIAGFEGVRCLRIRVLGGDVSHG